MFCCCCCCCYWVTSVMSNSVRPHRRQPTRLPGPWDSRGKNTGVGCHFLLQRMKVKSEREVARSCPTPRDSMDCSPPGSSIHGIFQARVLEWGAIAFSAFGPYLHGISFSSPALSVCMCPLFWGGSLVDSIYRGLVFVSISQSLSFGWDIQSIYI